MRRLRTVMVWVALMAPPAAGVTAMTVRHWHGSAAWQLGVVASAPYMMLLVPIGIVVALARRSWWMAVVSALVAGGCLHTQAPLYVADSSPVTEARVNVMTQNARLGRADATDIVRAVGDHQVHALVVTELTPAMRGSLKAAGLDEDLPFTASGSGPDGSWTTDIWSRTRLTEVRVDGGFTSTFVTARTRIDWGHGPSPVRLVGLHLYGPTFNAEAWRRDAELLPKTLRSLSDDTPTIVAGDFNATPDSPWLRKALHSGFTNAADSAGAGLVRTYPADHAVLAIDHVLTNGLIARSLERVRIDDTDHFGIVATLAHPVS